MKHKANFEIVTSGQLFLTSVGWGTFGGGTAILIGKLYGEWTTFQIALFISIGFGLIILSYLNNRNFKNNHIIAHEPEEGKTTIVKIETEV